jgi:hypothetical protein
MILRPQPRATFEPPRAGATRGMWNAWFTFLRRTRVRIPGVPLVTHDPNLSWRSLAVVALPIYGFLLVGKPATAKWAALLYAISAAVALVCLGWGAAGWAAGVMITIHGLGTAEYFFSGQLSPPPRHRVLRSAGVVVMLALIYTFVSRPMLALFVSPVQTDRGVILINTLGRVRSAAKEEIIAYQSPVWRVGNIGVPGGIYLGRVLGVAGDVITFDPQNFAVNGVAHARRPFMPVAGKLSIPEGNIFVWPLELNRQLRAQDESMDFAQRVALRPAVDIKGRAYSWWFWRKQTYEPVR